MLSGSHTHSTPGGHMQHLLFDLSVLGFVRQTFAALMAGIVIVSCTVHHVTMSVVVLRKSTRFLIPFVLIG